MEHGLISGQYQGKFGMDRKSQGSIVIEDCHLWTGPLPPDAQSFKAGERPGENAVDTKTRPDGERCKLTIRNCYMHGFNKPAQIGSMAALNLKENIDADVSHCVFDDNEIAFRVRGPGKRGGAHVTISDRAIYDSQVGVRAEDGIEQLKITRLAYGKGIGVRMKFVPAKSRSVGVESTDEREAPAKELLLTNGFP